MGNEDPRAALADCLADLADNKPAEAALARLRALEPLLRDDPLSRAHFLRARAIATNRLGFAGEALGDLHEARRLLEGGDHSQELAEIFRAIATVFSWRGESREAALALLRVVAEAGDDRLTIALALIEGGRLQMEIGRPADAQALFVRALAASAELPRREFQRAWVSLLQASVAAGRIEQAQAQRGAMNETLAGAPPRLLLLTELEVARCAIHDISLTCIHSLTYSRTPRSTPGLTRRLASRNIQCARETVRTKPLFREAFKDARCLMPVSGYYEWYYENPDDKKEKPQPYYFTRRDGGLMTTAITGLRGRDNLVPSCSLHPLPPDLY